MSEISKRATKAQETAIREKRVEIQPWGITFNCETTDEALLISYAYRANQYGWTIEERSDGRHNLTIFNSAAKGMGIGY